MIVLMYPGHLHTPIPFQDTMLQLISVICNYMDKQCILHV